MPAVMPVSFSAASRRSPGRAALYRRRVRESEKFERCRNGLPEWFGSNIDTGCLTASGVTVAFGTDEGFLFLSADAGTSWERMAKDLPAIQCVQVA
jgi:phage terminase small subunit